MTEYQKWYRTIYESKPKLPFCEWFDETDPLWNYTRHSHPYIELIYFVNGNSAVDISGTPVPFSIYDTLLMPANQYHKDDLTAERKREIICLWVDIPELELPEAILLRENQGLFHRLFLDIYNEQKSQEPNPMILEYQIKLLLTSILREHCEREDQKKALDKVLNYISCHFTERITVEELARMEYVSKSYLSRKFKQKTGCSIIEYVNDMRISAAKSLLVSSEKNVEDIAYEIGFESPKYFHRVFKAATEMTPAEYRKAYRSRRREEEN